MALVNNPLSMWPLFIAPLFIVRGDAGERGPGEVECVVPRGGGREESGVRESVRRGRSEGNMGQVVCPQCGNPACTKAAAVPSLERCAKPSAIPLERASPGSVPSSEMPSDLQSQASAPGLSEWVSCFTGLADKGSVHEEPRGQVEVHDNELMTMFGWGVEALAVEVVELDSIADPRELLQLWH